jgi:hypothetical protein
MTAVFKDICLDANDHQALADWWCAAMGYVRRHQEERPREWPVAIVDPAGRGPLIWVNPVAETKTVKNRLHIDLFGSTSELVAAGAKLVRAKDGEIEWDVLEDPEGNEFCVFAPNGA